MKRNKILKICLITALAVAVVAFAMSRTSVLKASETGDANYGETVPTAETVTQYIAIPQETKAAPAQEETKAAPAQEETKAAPAQEATEAACTCEAKENEPHDAKCPLYKEPAAAEASVQVSAETPAEAANEAPAEAPAEAATEAPAEAPAEAANEAPAEAPAEQPAEAPAEEAAEEPTEETTEATEETEPQETEAQEPLALDVSVQVKNLSEGEIYFGSKIRLTAIVANAPEGVQLNYQWYYSLDGVKWEAISGATAADYDFTLDEINNQYYWQVAVNF